MPPRHVHKVTFDVGVALQRQVGEGRRGRTGCCRPECDRGLALIPPAPVQGTITRRLPGCVELLPICVALTPATHTVPEVLRPPSDRMYHQLNLGTTFSGAL